MRKDVERNWTWADNYLPQVEQILKGCAEHLITISVAPMDKDRKQATDMMIKTTGGDIAVRLRRGDCDYRDLTIRALAGGRTEIDKIKEGYADFYLYGWTTNGVVGEWMLVDLSVARDMDLLENRNLIRNTDGRTGFIAIPRKELRTNNCILAEKP